MARKNTTQAVAAFINGQTYHAPGRNGSPIWTTGGVLYSYGQPIAKWSDADPHMAIVNMERFSVTTSCQQSGTLQLLRQHGKSVLTCSTTGDFKLTERA